jgi:membrane-bound lytic murein transglycosylase D
LLLHGTDTVMVRDYVGFDQISECIGVPMEDIKFFNPQYTKQIVPASPNAPRELRLPMKYALRFVQMEDSVYAFKSKPEVKLEEIVQQVKEVSDSFTHTVKRGESLGSIAKKYNVSVSNIKKWNGLRRDNIKVGQKLKIYRSGATVAQVDKKPAKNSKSAPAATTKTHTVKKGETLSSIGRKYHCSPNDIKKWNNLKNNNIKVGQKLKIKN